MHFKFKYVVFPYLYHERKICAERWATAVSCHHCHLVGTFDLEIKRPGGYQSITNQLKGVGAW